MRFLLSTGWLLALALAAGPACGQAPVASPADTTRHYTYTERMPVFPAQERADSARPTMQRVIRFLNKDLHFPAKALRDGVQGKVYLTFVVDEHGHTADIKVAKGLRADVDAEVLRAAQRLAAIQWQPGTQNGRPVRVGFTAPVSFSVSGGRPPRPGVPGTDSLDLPQFNNMKLPSASWNLNKPAPAGKGVLYGSCLQRLGFSSGGLGQYVRLVNLSTGQVFRLNVKPALRSRRENPFCYALPAGRYALSQYEFGSSPYTLQVERLLKAQPAAAAGAEATRYVFSLLPGQVHYVGTWNFANANEPLFILEKELLDPIIQSEYPAANLAGALVALPH